MSFIKSRKKGKKQEIFVPRNPEKYKGSYPILIRSSWERMFSQWLDANPLVLEWSSESLTIPYYDPLKRKTRRYYPDFFIKVLNNNNKAVSYVVEVKPEHELYPPKKGNKSKKTIMWQEATYVTNQAKWKAAENYCKKMGHHFKIITENQLFK